MPDPLAIEFRQVEAAFAAAQAAPLSVRRALLAAVLLDHLVDAGYVQGGDTDLMAYRRAHAGRSPALAAIMAVGNQTARLELQPVTVPIADYPALGVEDFMVSLYNQNTVQRVMLVSPDREPVQFHPLLEQALAFVRLLA